MTLAPLAAACLERTFSFARVASRLKIVGAACTTATRMGLPTAELVSRLAISLVFSELLY